MHRFGGDVDFFVKQTSLKAFRRMLEEAGYKFAAHRRGASGYHNMWGTGESRRVTSVSGEGLASPCLRAATLRHTPATGKPALARPRPSHAPLQCTDFVHDATGAKVQLVACREPRKIVNNFDLSCCCTL